MARPIAVDFFMPSRRKRYYGLGHLHFMACSCISGSAGWVVGVTATYCCYGTSAFLVSTALQRTESGATQPTLILSVDTAIRYVTEERAKWRNPIIRNNADATLAVLQQWKK